MICKVCGNNENNKVHKAKEMMFGLNDSFDYLECGGCGCVQIIDIPSDMSKYYPSKYYSLDVEQNKKHSLKKGLANFIFDNIHKRLNSFAYKNKGWLNKLLYKKFPYEISEAMRSLYLIKFKNKNARILDVGCGSGDFLQKLQYLGFKNLTGVDPFLKKDIYYESGVKIFKKYVTDLDGQYDLVTFHHSFEHIPNPLETLNAVEQLLPKGGLCLIRIPVADSYAFTKYQTNWVEFDAPRHFFLHTLKSIEILAQKAGLVLEDVIHDSTKFQFMGSEQYLKGIPLTSSKSYLQGYKLNFTDNEIKEYEEKSKELNILKKGGRAIFLLKK